jgi:hypothetical protein
MHLVTRSRAPAEVSQPEDTWLALLRAEWKRVDARLRGYSAMTTSRVINGRGKATMSAADEAARALREVGVDMPPPMVRVIDRDDYEWLQAGRALREAAPDLWRRVLDAVHSIGAERLTKSMDQLRSIISDSGDVRKKT